MFQPFLYYDHRIAGVSIFWAECMNIKGQSCYVEYATDKSLQQGRVHLVEQDCLQTQTQSLMTETTPCGELL